MATNRPSSIFLNDVSTFEPPSRLNLRLIVSQYDVRECDITIQEDNSRLHESTVTAIVWSL